VIEFLRKMKKGGESELGHNPSSEDLLPYFQRYAWSVIEARNKEEIVNATSISKAQALIRNAVETVVYAICRLGKTVDGTKKPSEVWFQTIKHASRAVTFGSWTTDYGTYDQTAFSHPPHMQLRALLLVQGRELVTQFWSRKAMEDQSARIDDPTAPPAVPVAPNAGPTKGRLGGTTRRIYKGLPVRQMTLDKVADALSKKLSKVSPSDIPKC
jgi:hypothetical protein